MIPAVCMCFVVEVFRRSEVINIDCSVLSPGLASLSNLVINLSLVVWRGQDLSGREPL